jgi:uncharacterized sulfatase
VLFIAADDLRAGLDVFGETVQTPNIDRLARMGRRFDRAYSQIPMCSPSRASVMSGRRPETTGLFGNREPVREALAGAVPLQELFAANGYFTGRVGKIYHSRYEDEFVWDTAEDFAVEARELGENALRDEPGAGASVPFDDHPTERAAEIWGPTTDEDGDLPDGKSARRVAELLGQRRSDPFFIAVGFISTHFPLLAPKKYFDLYDMEAIQSPSEPPDDREDIPRIALSPGANVKVRPSERPAVARAYLASVSFMDAQVGVVLEAMDRHDLWKNTIVVFWSDHGFHLGEHGGLFRKGTLFEETTRVPLVIVTPEMNRRGVPTEQLAELVDLYPTLAELARLPDVKGLEGTSLVPLLRDPETPIKTAAFSVVHRPSGLGRSVRTDRFRYTEWPDGSVELYDQWTDPQDHTNLAQYPVHGATAETMKRLLRDGYRAALATP